MSNPIVLFDGRFFINILKFENIFNLCIYVVVIVLVSFIPNAFCNSFIYVCKIVIEFVCYI